MNYRWLTWCGLIALLAIAFFRRPPHPAVNTEAMVFEAQLTDGSTFNLAQRRGQVVVLDFWATWCAPCRRSLPALSAVAARYADDDQVWIGSVNDERRSDASIERFLDRMKLKFPVIRDLGSQISRMYGVDSIPTLIIIDPHGKIVYQQAGLVSSHTPTLVKHLETHIEKARRGAP